MHIAIVGAGITGLSAAYRLSLEGHRVTVFEASDTAGGLGSSIEVGNKHVERFYHHFFQSDRHVIELIRELGLSEKLHFYPSKTSVFHKGHVYPFSGPVDLLRFKPLSFADRIRCGLVLVYLKYAPVNNEKLDLIPAASWLKKYAGRESYRVIWEPLLVGKFEEWSDDIPLAWLKDRLRDRTFKLGYLESGAHTLFEELLLQTRPHTGCIVA
jgi:protoporphyrinogen oxidase